VNYIILSTSGELFLAKECTLEEEGRRTDVHGIRSLGVGILRAGLTSLAVHAACLVIIVVIVVLLALGSVDLVRWLIVSLIRVLTVVAVHGIVSLPLGVVLPLVPIHHVVLGLVVVLSLSEILSWAIILPLVVALPLIVVLRWIFHELAVLLLSVCLLRLLITLRAFLAVGCALRHVTGLGGFSHR
jgi:hypothetical protein